MGITAATIFCAALIFVFLMKAPPADSARFEAAAETLPSAALDEIAAELAGGYAKNVRLVPPMRHDESVEIHYEYQEKPVAVKVVIKVVDDPKDPYTGLLVRHSDASSRTICRGVRRGGFRGIEVDDGWVLKLELIRWERDGSYITLAAPRTVSRPEAAVP
ncbi:MAG: hypothetical protein HY716_03280 [Planctomycetes bacterium]|nr:hypothetical protein [Planctomycetota bacterium]